MARRKPKSLPDSATVRGQLAAARHSLREHGLPSAWLDAEVLLAFVLKTRRAWLLSHPERRLTPLQRRRYRRLTAERARHVPIAYLRGEKEFYGYVFRVSPAVLIPRPETELLVERAIDWLRKHPAARRVIDLGTGSGAIAVAIGKSMPDARIVAIDVDPAALRVAAQNMGRHRLSSRVQLVRRDLLTGSRAADLIVANLPYLSSGSRRSWPKELGFEPLRALDGGSSGLEFIQRALAQAPAVLRKDGCMLLECDPKQVQRINKMVLRAWPASTVTIHKDLAGRDRVVQIQV